MQLKQVLKVNVGSMPALGVEVVMIEMSADITTVSKALNKGYKKSPHLFAVALPSFIDYCYETGREATTIVAEAAAMYKKMMGETSAQSLEKMVEDYLRGQAKEPGQGETNFPNQKNPVK